MNQMRLCLKRVGGRVHGQGGLGAKTSGDGGQFRPVTDDKLTDRLHLTETGYNMFSSPPFGKLLTILLNTVVFDVNHDQIRTRTNKMTNFEFRKG